MKKSLEEVKDSGLRFWNPRGSSVIVKVILWLLPVYLLLFLWVWQGVEKAMLVQRIRQKVAQRKELIRKNDELKIGIVSYTSAERIEALYRKTFQFLPISAVGRIVTVELPKVPNENTR